MENNLIGRVIDTDIGKVTLQKLLGKGKSGYSYLAFAGQRKLVFKQMHFEECAYYDFGENNKVDLEINAYDRLKNANLNIPNLICYNSSENFLIKELVDGPTATELIIYNKLKESIVSQLFDIYRLAKKSNINIDYFPSNFVTQDNQLYYIDYEFNPYMEEWDLLNWGIYYWANSEGFRKFQETGDSLFINQSNQTGIPIKAPFQKQVNDWIRKFL